MYGAAATCKDIARVSRNKLGTPLCGVLLRREAWDESSARNSVSCQSLATWGVMVCGNVTWVYPPYPLGTVRPLYKTGVSLLSRELFLYI